MKNTIAERVADFLKLYPPFSFMEIATIRSVASQVKILYCEKGKTIFQRDDERHDHFYVVHKGAITLFSKDTSNDLSSILDTCDEGDVFGLRPLVAGERYVLSAKATEESILYGIPIDIFRPIAEANLQVGYFLVESFASNTRNPYATSHRGHLYTSSPPSSDERSNLFELQPAKIVKSVVTAHENDTVKAVAKKMTKQGVGSIIIVDAEFLPIGVITDKDLRTKVATGNFTTSSPAKDIMSHPVICYPGGITMAQAQMAMVKHKIGHLCITKDGTPKSKLQGIISEHDLVVSQGNNPAVLIKAIQRAERCKELKQIRQKIMLLLNGYMQQNIPMTHVSKIITELNDATIKKIIELTLAKMGSPPCKFAWMSLGSQGRKEQLLHTDQDNALVFEDVDEEALEKTKTYFLELANQVTKRLNKVGYEYCPADMMASNPKWCLSLSEWKAQFSHWIVNPGEEEILLSTIFFDFDISYGDVNLTLALSDHIFETTEKHQRFIAMLGVNALKNASPMGFFRQFIVERDGNHKDFFDLKKRALMPLTDAGRLLILSKKVKHINNTAERFEKLASLEPENAEIYTNCSYAAKALLKFRTKQGLLNNDSGRYIALEKLSKQEKIKLKRTFKAIEQVQSLIKVRFQLNQLL